VKKDEKGCGRDREESDNNKLMLLFIKCDESGVSASKCNYFPSSLHSSMPFPFHLHGKPLGISSSGLMYSFAH